eukprot:ctg_940.g406
MPSTVVRPAPFSRRYETLEEAERGGASSRYTGTEGAAGGRGERGWLVAAVVADRGTASGRGADRAAAPDCANDTNGMEPFAHYWCGAGATDGRVGADGATGVGRAAIRHIPRHVHQRGATVGAGGAS